MAVIQAEHLAREYVMGKNVIRAVDDISFTIQEGTYTMILGASGAGKSTVLNLLGGMDSPTSGSLRINGRDIARFNKRQLAEYRRNSIGFVFQFYNLMPNLTMRENVELASQICKDPLDAQETLELVGLGERSSNFPSQCSGGEQQRGGRPPARAQKPPPQRCAAPPPARGDNTRHALRAPLCAGCTK
ncbi:MAG: ATP-binding cassette domain-containing protein, partial [Oscillospiraceae bacterium]|nr:ATP-binding cassette domain-containing protein [Oscillospiraceae bacterium]